MSATEGAIPRATDTPVATPRATVRDPRLDVFRGMAMIIILFAHTPGNWITLWIPARWGFSDATEIFVFCSGMASAIAFGRTYDRAGWTLGTARVAYRVWQVYWAHVCLFMATLALTVWMTNSGLGTRNYWGQLNLWPVIVDGENWHNADIILSFMTLRYVPNYFDILPMYLVILALMPIVMFLGDRSRWWAAGFVVLLWIAAQEWSLDLALPAEPWTEREWFFNPFGWQLAFFTGFALMRGWIPAPPVNKLLIGVALAIVLLNIPFSSIGARELGLRELRAFATDHPGWIGKSDFGILRYVHFLALAYLAWAAAGQGGHRLIARGRGVASEIYATIIAVLTKIGQQSLAIFVFSMALARLMGMGFDIAGRSYASQTIINLAGVAAVIAVAYGVAWFKGQPWRVAR